MQDIHFLFVRCLEKFGFGSAARTVLRHADSGPPVADEFFASAESVLRDAADVVLDAIVPSLSDVYGRWHPTGFMVFPLGVDPALGTLRLHIWPRGTRQREPKGRGYLGDLLHDGDIHNHMWHISSLVLSSYADRFFETATLADRPVGVVTEEDHYRIFRVTYEGAAPETLCTTGASVRARASADRAFSGGQVHTIRCGQYHAPVVPPEEVGATLVLSSFRIRSDGPDVLIGGGPEPIVGNRRDVTVDESRRAGRDLLRALSGGQ